MEMIHKSLLIYNQVLTQIGEIVLKSESDLKISQCAVHYIVRSCCSPCTRCVSKLVHYNISF